MSATETPNPLDLLAVCKSAREKYNLLWSRRSRGELGLDDAIIRALNAYVAAQAAYVASLEEKAGAKIGDELPGVTARAVTWTIEAVRDDGSVLARSDFGKRQTIPAERVRRMIELRDMMTKQRR